MSVHLYALPEYEPPLHPVPLDPDELDVGVPLLAPVAAVEPSVDTPVWDEPWHIHERLRRMVCLVLEVLDGRRQLRQLTGIVDASVYESLLTRYRQVGPAGWQHRLRTLRTCRPSPGTVELCATVAVVTAGTRHPRTIAIAARVNIRRGDRLLCTALRLLYPNLEGARSA